MKYRNLGSSGLLLSEVSYGSAVTFGRQVDEQAACECMTAAYEAGVNFFDNAEFYAKGQSEIIMGNVFKRTGWRRSSYVVSTKFYMGLYDRPNERHSLSRKRLMEGIAGSLKRLQVEYVDLIFCHRPDPSTPIEETVRAMDDIIHRGQALYWGTSEWSAAQVMRAYGIARQYGLYPPQMEQPQYNLLHRQRFEIEYAPLYEEIGLGATTWRPLDCGVLTGKYNSGVPADSRAALPGQEWVRDACTPEVVEQLGRLHWVADQVGCTLAQLALAWCLKNPHVSSAIAGATRPEQVRENVRAVEVADRLSADVMESIEVILGNKPQPPAD